MFPLFRHHELEDFLSFFVFGFISIIRPLSNRYSERVRFLEGRFHVYSSFPVLQYIALEGGDKDIPGFNV